jgi:hypothetical protein
MDMIKSPELEPQDDATAQTDRVHRLGSHRSYNPPSAAWTAAASASPEGPLQRYRPVLRAVAAAAQNVSAHPPFDETLAGNSGYFKIT